ncbi:sigma-70 family RNA polymerase sigma factor [Modestobacter sp. VKM Ac-2983]|uniref:RNA polymerase sigma factor n=1 Tax=Modestobacter sp. VKM Ac-2983 TaxID=3004137 RepID=UPI0022AB53F9|nr:sigma-70 family RNA polymerase sigma factor [Modestobacter sp. VKM Ac-2983]MCZ2803571.1 sigma-70 family RNA polymerase sigma factor [Modestobacter sp. VKM Ac-2983]
MTPAQERFSALYAAHYGEVLAYCLRRAAPETARDAAAETFLVAWRRPDSVPDDPIAYLIKTASLVLRGQARSSRRQDRTAAKLSTVSDQLFADHADVVAVSADMTQALRRLSAGDRELLMLSAWEDLDAATIAKVIGCSTATARVRLHRARRRLAQHLQEPSPAHQSNPSPVHSFKETA